MLWEVLYEISVWQRRILNDRVDLGLDRGLKSCSVRLGGG